MLLKNLKIETVEPIAALEKKKFGQTYDSRIIYNYREGKSIGEQHYPKMIEIIDSIHKNGYLHDDPHSKNFLCQGEKVFAIDCKPRLNLIGQLGFVHNYIDLARRSEYTELIYNLIGHNPKDNILYKIVNFYIDLQQFRRKLKNKFRKTLKSEHKLKNQ